MAVLNEFNPLWIGREVVLGTQRTATRRVARGAGDAWRRAAAVAGGGQRVRPAAEARRQGDVRRARGGSSRGGEGGSGSGD